MLKKLSKRFLENKRALVLIVLGATSWSLTMVKSGLVHDFGLGFWGANGHDGIWHIALAESLARGSWEVPVFAGHALQNYHLGFDLILALAHKITTIPLHNLYFQIFPPIIAVTLGLLVYKFVYLWQKNRSSAFWATFFVYFAGSFGWLIGRGESAFWAQQSISALINPPFALSLVILLLGIIFLQKYKKHNTYYLILATAAFGSLIQIKAYAGLLSLLGLFIAGIWELYKNKNASILKVFVGALVLSVLLFIPFNRSSGNLVVYKPFWFLETMMQLTDRVGWVRFGEAMVNYKYGNIFYKAIPAYLIAFIIFWYGNMGMRFLGELYLAKKIIKKKALSSIEVFVIVVILAGVAAPMLFLQKGTPWNTIQFFYYSLFFSGLLAGVAFAGILNTQKNLRLKKWLIIGIILFTLPTTISSLLNVYLPTRPPAKLSSEEYEALSFLSDQPNGVVLTYPFDEILAKEAEKNPPRPLYLYVSNAYVAAFSKKQVFLEDEVNLNIMGYDWQTRRAEVEKFYQSLDQEFTYNFLRENNIAYVYWVKPQRATLGESQLGIERIFENKEVDIYKVVYN